MNVQLDAELVMELRADCPEEDRLVVGGNDWGYLKVIQIKGGHFEGEKLRGRVVPGGADWNMGVGGAGAAYFDTWQWFNLSNT